MAAPAAVNLHRLADDVAAIPRAGMIAAARAAKEIAAQEGTKLGGPLKGKKRRGLRLAARDTIKGNGDLVVCRVQGVSPAGWVWVTTGTAPHAIRRRKRGPMRKMTVDHPGSRGRRGWDRVVDRVTAVVPEIFRDEVRRAVR